MCINCKTGGKPISAIWWRVSRPEQLEGSPEDQINQSRALAESEGYTVPDEYVIGADWHSLDTLECPEMQTILGWIRRHEVHGISMINSDRLSGEMAQKLAIMDISKKNDVKLMAVQHQIESGPEGEILETVHTYAKYLQVIRAQEGSRDGLHARVNGKRLPATGNAPYGFKFRVIKEDGREAKDHTTLEPNDDWRIAEMVLRLGLSGMSQRAIQKEFHQRGIKTATGREVWCKRSIANIWKNPVYAGRYAAMRSSNEKPVNSEGNRRYKRSVKKEKPMSEWVFLDNINVTKPVIAWDEFLFLQERIAKNKANSPRNAKHPYLLRGMIRCERHDRIYRGKRHGGLRYVCGAQEGVKDLQCSRAYINGADLERTVWERAKELLTHPELILGEVERRKQAKEETEANLQEALQATLKRLTRIDGEEMELSGMRMRKEVRDDIFARQTALLNAERTWCEEEVGRVGRQLEQVRKRFVTIEQVRVLRDRVQGKLDEATDQDRRFVLETLDTEIVVTEARTTSVTFAIPESQASIATTVPYSGQ